ncbi:MAG: ABC transporter ATP-binding protein [Patescibacteria group bacterium]|jgi:ABC-type multidrug transport system fused ATPase/permease subunit
MANFWKKLWILLDLSQRKLKFLFVILIIFELLRLIGPYLLKLIIDELISFKIEKVSLILMMIAGMFLSEQITSLVAYFKDKKIFAILIDMEYYLPTRAQKKLVSLSLNYHEKENTGNKISKIQRGVDKISDLMANMCWEVIPTLIQLVATFAILLIVDWRFGFLFFLFAPTFIWVTYKVNRGLHSIREQRHRDYEESAGKMGESIININTVQSFVQEKREVKEYSSIREMIKVNELKEWFKILQVNIGRNFIVDTGRISILLLGVYLVWHGQVSIGTLVFVITLSEKSFFSLFRLSRFYDKIQESSVAVDRFINLANENPDIKNKANGLKPKIIRGEIEFREVEFTYEESNAKALDNVSFKIAAGTINAFVGPSGGGKTTVARMIYRHYDPQSGTVLLDGRDLREYDLYGFRQFIAIVPQEVEIFNASVQSNIAYSNPKATPADIRRAARIANAEEFIKNLKNGYETEVGERGIKLSGGQRQRIGIARAILADPKILIFDEATSSLDSHSEKLIQEAMERISKQRTVIMIAHRLSTIRNADRIFVLEDGRLVERGSHSELSDAKRGLYAHLLKLQQEGDVD